MTTYYKATFSDGTTLTRSTADRKYSHGWLVRWTYVQPRAHPHGRSAGFSGTEALARKQLGGWSDYDKTYATVTLREAAPAVEISAAEYRALGKRAVA